MKIFKSTDGENVTNIVDSNNVFFGFWGFMRRDVPYFFSHKQEGDIANQAAPFDLEPWNFDPTFYKEGFENYALQTAQSALEL